jgi:hypothetical protein
MSHKSSGIKLGETVLFLHTGGALGMYDKAEQLLPLLSDQKVEKLVVDRDSLS